MSNRMSIGEFARLSGVSQRALRFYEEKGMLTPSYISESGRRYYETDDLVPLQQIISYKYLGFPLEEIKAIMKKGTGNMLDSLTLQKQAMEQKRDHINQMIKAIDHTVEILRTDKTVDPQVFSFIIHSIVTEKEQLEWIAEYFTESTVTRLKQHFEDKDKELEWNKRSALLLQQIKRTLAQHPPDSEEVQTLIDELVCLTKDIFGGDWSELQAAAEQIEHISLPHWFTSPFNAAEEHLVDAALEYYLKVKGMFSNEE